ncbi:hypothetical protein [Streptomyces uncialis]|uniref:hypothetical protein n=1 Tax=Streptomyces uncialis TaxID=1048205 RepID=UPI0037A11C66
MAVGVLVGVELRERALCSPARVSVFFCSVPKAYYVRKEKEGKGHEQAVLALARRRVNVLWAMIRDHTPFRAAPAFARAA